MERDNGFSYAAPAACRPARRIARRTFGEQRRRRQIEQAAAF